MRQEDIEERLVDWELARQRGEELDSADLLADSGVWRTYLEQRLEVLRKTSWMLQDPVLDPLVPQLSKLVSEAVATIKSSTSGYDTPLSQPGDQQPQRAETSESTQSGQQAVRANLKPPAQMPEVPGFRCLGQLGKGGFGIVYRALDETLQRPVAIKFPLIGGQRERQQYIAEARNASQVEVPGIVPIYSVGQTSDGTPYVIQKLIDGKSLREILRFGCLSPSQTAELFGQICRAVAAAHAQALVHRDLKPENILVDQQGVPWITDFGLSISEDDPQWPVAGVAGTPNFMSPEQIMGKVEWLDGRCDIWALGVMLYQCLTGRLPFHSSTHLGLQDKILHFEPRPIAQRQPGLRGNWDKIFRKCCAKSISDRYNNALEMADDLTQLGRGLVPDSEKHNAVLHELQESDLTRRRSPGRASWRGHHLDPISALALGALTLVLAVVLAVVLLQHLRPTDEFVVASDGSGTHRSIQAALAAASDNTSIFIEPGVYRESLVVAHRAILRGRGPSAQIRIVGRNAPAFTINLGGHLAAYGVSIEVDDQTAGVWNAIDVHGGAVLLNDCAVRANQFDCIRLQAGSALQATNCDFHNSLHPAIFAQLAKELNVRECRFHIGSNGGGQTKYLAGMQVLQSGGTVSECSFMGTSAVGIEWTEAAGLVTIDDCDFNNLERAIIATACLQLQLGGHGRALFENCHTAIELTGCAGSIKNCNIDCRGRLDGRGILIRGTAKSESPMDLQACQIRGAQAPLVLSQAKVNATSLSIDGSSDMGIRLLDNSLLEMNSSHVRNCEVVGLLLEGSQARLQRCTLAGNQTAGVVVDGLDDALRANGCLIDDNPVGVVVLSGAARLENTQIQRATTGVLLARRHLLTFAATCDAQLSLTAIGGSITARQHAIQFLSPGSYRLTDCQTSDPDNSPVLDENLQRIESADLSEVRVIASQNESSNERKE